MAVIIRCKMCGGELSIAEGATVAECEYCGSKQTIPNQDNEKKLNLFARAERLRRACEFDKAAGVYETIVAEFPEEAEAYWGLVLCRYGIEYVDDPATRRKVPTCHRSSFDSILEDTDFQQACENTDAIARRVYREEARTIDGIRQGILAVSAREEPYDLFICYKETDENGGRTIDSVMAQDVYNELTKKGYRVFFSRISLEDKLGSEYEPYIFAALNSAKIMLVFGTDYEYFNAVWVKNEWSRFLALIAAGQKKTLIPCYKDLDAYDMPDEFRRLQAQDLGKVGAIQDLLRGIDKIMGRTAAPVHRASQARDSLGNEISLGFMDLQSGQFDSAEEVFRDVLKKDISCAEAYLGLLLFRDRDAQQRESYFDQLRKYLPARMTAQERQIISRNHAREFLNIYSRLEDAGRVDGVFDLFPDLADEVVSMFGEDAYDELILFSAVKHGMDLNQDLTVTQPNTYSGTGERFEAPTILNLTLQWTKNAELIRCMLEHGADPNGIFHYKTDEGEGRQSPLGLIFNEIKNPAIELIEALLEYGADPNYVFTFTDNGGFTSREPMLNLAINETENFRIVELLVEHGADVNCERHSRNGEWIDDSSALMDAVWGCDLPEIVELLLKRGADPDYVSRRTCTDGQFVEQPVLYQAVQLSISRGAVGLLLERGANPNVISHYKTAPWEGWQSPLGFLLKEAENPAVELIEALLAHGADPNYIFELTYNDGFTSRDPMLNLAIRNGGDCRIVELLVEHGANVGSERHFRTTDGWINDSSALMDAVWGCDLPEIVELLLKRGADPDYVSRRTCSDGQFTEEPILHQAITSNQSRRSVELLLEYSADSNVGSHYKNNNGEGRQSPLGLLFNEVKDPAPELVEALLEHGADPNYIFAFTYNDGFTSRSPMLNLAINKTGDFRIVELLVEHGANVNSERHFRTTDGWIDDSSALMDAVWGRDLPEIVELLLKHGADLGYISRRTHSDGRFTEQPILHQAIKSNKSTRVVELLLEHGANPNVTSPYKTASGEGRQSPLGLLLKEVKEPAPELVEALLSHGADPNYVFAFTYNDGFTSRDPMLSIAITATEDFRIVKLLVEHGANVNSECHFRTTDGWIDDSSALMDAVWSRDLPEIVELLLKRGADHDYVSRRIGSDGQFTEQPILYQAIKSNKSARAVELLLEHGANPNVISRYKTASGEGQQSPLGGLFNEVEEPAPAVAEMLLSHGADPNYVFAFTYNDGFTSRSPMLNLAVSRTKNLRIVELLVKYHARLNSDRHFRNTNGWVVDSGAVTDAWDLPDILELLLRQGADVERERRASHKDGSVETATPLCFLLRYSKNLESIKILLKYRANVNSYYKLRKPDGFRIQATPMCLAAKDMKSPEAVRLLKNAGGVSWGKTITWGKQTAPLRAYPFDREGASPEVLSALRDAGWQKSGGLFGLFG